MVAHEPAPSSGPSDSSGPDSRPDELPFPDHLPFEPPVRQVVSISMPRPAYAKWERMRAQITAARGGPPLADWEVLEACLEAGLSSEVSVLRRDRDRGDGKAGAAAEEPTAGKRGNERGDGAGPDKGSSDANGRVYDPRELAQIIIGEVARRGDVTITPVAAAAIAAVSRGSAREALRLLASARTGALAAGRIRIDRHAATRTLEDLGIDERGLRPKDREYLQAVHRGPVRLARLAQLLGMDERMLVRDVEPHLIREGLIRVTPRGRVATAAGTRRASGTRRERSAGRPKLRLVGGGGSLDES